MPLMVSWLKTTGVQSIAISAVGIPSMAILAPWLIFAIISRSACQEETACALQYRGFQNNIVVFVWFFNCVLPQDTAFLVRTVRESDRSHIKRVYDQRIGLYPHRDLGQNAI